MAGATALDQLEEGIHLIGAVDGQINAIHGVEALQRNAELGGEHLPLERGGHPHNVAQLTAAELFAQALDHQGGGGAGAQPQHHAVADLFHGGRGNRLLHLVLKIRHRWRWLRRQTVAGKRLRTGGVPPGRGASLARSSGRTFLRQGGGPDGELQLLLAPHHL